jgi:hypothetical protein
MNTTCAHCDGPARIVVGGSRCVSCSLSPSACECPRVRTEPLWLRRQRERSGGLAKDFTGRLVA